MSDIVFCFFQLLQTGIADTLVNSEEALIDQRGVVRFDTDMPLFPCLLLPSTPSSTPTYFKILRWAMESVGLDAPRDMTLEERHLGKYVKK